MKGLRVTVTQICVISDQPKIKKNNNNKSRREFSPPANLMYPFF